MQIHREDRRAIFASDDGNWKNHKRLAKSSIKIEPNEPDERKEGIVHVTMSEAYAYEKGLI
jgi:hypothetical protein